MTHASVWPYINPQYQCWQHSVYLFKKIILSILYTPSDMPNLLNQMHSQHDVQIKLNRPADVIYFTMSSNVCI